MKTLVEKIWESHQVAAIDDYSLLYVDRLLLYDSSGRDLKALNEEGRAFRRPDLAYATVDHFIQTSPNPIGSPRTAEMVGMLTDYSKDHGFKLFGLGDRARGIMHVIGPDLGITMPGLTVVCGDSHTATHGGLGALAFGVGASEVKHVLATQCIWQKRPRTLLVHIDGRLGECVSAKDIILKVISLIGSEGGTGYAIEFAGTAVESLELSQRLTICNMAIEAGAKIGMIAPDDKTFNFLRGKPYAPWSDEWESAVAYWRTLKSDTGATYDRTLVLRAEDIRPMVTWGTNPQDAIDIDGLIPDPSVELDPSRRARLKRALNYMGLSSGRPVSGTPIDRVFIGSCTNSRIEDLREVGAILRGRRVAIPTTIVPGSSSVKRLAETEGLAAIFLSAGAEWREAGCSMCVGMNGEIGAPGERIASTSNRNFEGRQGPGTRTHLLSPAMAAAAAVSGQLVDIRELVAKKGAA